YTNGEINSDTNDSKSTLKETRKQLPVSKITQLEAQVLNHQQLKDKYEKEIQTNQKKITQLEQSFKQKILKQPKKMPF
ncbi:22611_t:CDS:1, partial [Gigaspora margarita]